MKKLLIIAIGLITLLGCKKDPIEPPIIKENLPPKDFEIIIDSTSLTEAQIHWTEAIDPENEKVFYDIKINDVFFKRKLSERSYTLTSLRKDTKYEIEVIAKDNKGKTSVARKTFSTKMLPLPSDIEVNIDSVGHDFVNLSWSHSSVDGDAVIYYTLMLADSFLIRKTDNNNLGYKIVRLKPDTKYEGSILIASNSTQTRTVEFEFTTKKNSVVEKFDVDLVYHGIHFCDIGIVDLVDPDNDKLDYTIYMDDIDITNTDDVKFYSNVARIINLDADRTYKLQLKVTDGFGVFVESNPLEFTTKPAPPDSFDFEVAYSNTTTIVKWKNLIEDKFNNHVASEGTSFYYLDGEKHSLGSIYASDKDGYRIFHFKDDEITPNEEHTLKIELFWGHEKVVSTSSTVNIFNAVYSNTTSKVKSAKIYDSTSEFFPLNYTITFEDGFISEFESYEIKSINFHNKNYINNYVFLEQGARNKGYLSASISQDDFDDLVLFTDGYIEILDENGLHKLEFQYTYIQ